MRTLLMRTRPWGIALASTRRVRWVRGPGRGATVPPPRRSIHPPGRLSARAPPPVQSLGLTEQTNLPSARSVMRRGMWRPETQRKYTRTDDTHAAALLRDEVWLPPELAAAADPRAKVSEGLGSLPLSHLPSPPGLLKTAAMDWFEDADTT